MIFDLIIKRWSEHSLGGTDTVIESIAVIPSEDLSYSEVWMVVKRTVNSATVRYIEVMEDVFFMDNQEDAVQTDCSKTYSGTATATITGLDHLEGEEVYILAEGSTHAPRTVTSGQITLKKAYTKVTCGLYYDGDVDTLEFDAVNDFNGPSLGQIRRITEIILRIFEAGVVWGKRADQAADKLYQLHPRESDDKMDTATGLKSGLYEIQTESNWDLSSRATFHARSPQPATVSAIMYKANVHEG